MWQFERYKRKQIEIPPTAIMTMRTGLETRYADRFWAYAGTTDENIRNTDEARKAVDSIRTATGVIDTQKENISDLFLLAETIVKMVNDFQRKSGIRQVKNVPLPGASIKESPGKQLGYVKLIMKFISSGLIHFMDVSLQMKDDLDSRDKILKMIAENSVEVPIVGRLAEVELDDLSSEDPIIDTKESLSDSDDDESIPETKAPGPVMAPVVTPITPPKTPQPKIVKPKPASPVTGKPAKK